MHSWKKQSSRFKKMEEALRLLDSELRSKLGGGRYSLSPLPGGDAILPGWTVGW